MTPFLKTYIIDAPWRSILLSGLFFALAAGGLNLLVSYNTSGATLTGSWYGDLAIWYPVGMLVGYNAWTADGYLERRNARWKAKKEVSRIQGDSTD